MDAIIPYANLSLAALAGSAPAIGAIAVALLWWLGGRGRPRPRERWRTPCLATGLLVVAVATSGPFDRAADRLFWAHMGQHALLMEVAAPLVVLARPWTRTWRPFPRIVRNGLASRLARSRLLGSPVVALVAMNAAFVAWHVPAAYDAALASPAVHAAEHLAFFGTALVLWAHLSRRGPFRVRLSHPRAAAYAGATMVVGWVLAVVLAGATRPLYPHYSAITGRPGGISAIADQQLAAGVMWVPASVPWTIAAIALLYAWLHLDRTHQHTTQQLHDASEARPR